MTKRALIDYCLTYPAAFEDYPFDDHTALIKHRGNGKMFALVDYLNERLRLNLKCDPIKADFLRSIFTDVTPGWHMNKKHWNTVYIGGDVPMEEVYDMIKHSYDLIKPKPKTYKFNAVIQKTPDMDGAYIAVPFDIKEIFGKGRLKVHATFDGEPYDGSIVNMSVKNEDGTVCYIIGIRKDIRAKIGKQANDTIKVTIKERF